MSRYDWSKAPEWAKYAATDQDGSSWFYETKPEILNDLDLEFTPNKYGRVWKIRPEENDEWKNSLEERPK